MQIQVGRDSVETTPCDGLVVGIFEKESLAGAVEALDGRTVGLISKLIESGEIKGKFKEFTILHTPSEAFKRIIVIGLGKKESFEEDRLRSLAARGARILRRIGGEHLALISHSHLGVDPVRAATALVEGAVMGLYKFRRHKPGQAGAPPHELKTLTLIPVDAAEAPSLKKGSDRGRILAEAVLFARDMINEPANEISPNRMAELAGEMARDTVEIEILDETHMKKLGMGALLAVAQGSQTPPRLVFLRYLGASKTAPLLGLVGKGITFDSGGLSLKDAEGMYRMYSDMSGAAAVISAMGAIARLKLKVNVIAVCPATENMPSGTAYRPGDIIKSMEGKTIEILNTDAEGRLILADGLAYARHRGAKFLIDVATLTGACSVALGHLASGIFGSRPEFIDLVRKAGDDCGERYWPLPLYEEYMDLIRSDVADLENSGGRYGGASTAAIFLREFTGGVPWVHLDIAPTALIDSDKSLYANRPYLPKEGGTGVAVRTLVGVAERMKELSIQMAVDMHMHTTASDGTLVPRDLVRRCSQRGLRIIAVSDHDTTGGLEEAMDEAAKLGIKVIPAIEINTDVRLSTPDKGKEMTEVHVLGYFIDYKLDWFQKKLEMLREGRTNRVGQMLVRLREAGIDIPRADVDKFIHGQSAGRPHVAQALVEAGHARDINDAFDKWLSVGRPGYVGRMKFDPEEAITTIAASGGIPVLAHPGLIGDDSLIPPLIEAGLQGIEAYHPYHDSATQRRYCDMARKYNIATTAGSDYHGSKIHAGAEPGCMPWSLKQFEEFCAIVGRDFPG